ncbi:dihydropteroate synthase [Virgibacillus sp. MSP4-1]|uniref:dihydropteroate synthase n=1 Tax=Virgibacillus sp. MSP4-1 TaxID=2700081 RepID=UPI00039E1004|nr:dihydropteroate synthase [Virgibacillus sp. MSP4-1]QHS23907.1 dihydropteroate synthase [Virgibacillus sp. MSP4-1]
MNQMIHINDKSYDLNKKTLVMGILNVTPDSFSDGGKFFDEHKAVEHAKTMVQDGADMIDIGGESTRPGHTPVPAQEELERIIPSIKALRKAVDVPISVDTFKARTADEALKAGAHIINDIWGAKKDPEIADVAADHHAPIILMHNRNNQDYSDIIEDMKKDLAKSVDIAKEAGVKDEQIILDPGVGFAKSMEENLLVMRRLDELTTLGYPLLLGTSRKRVIDYVLDLPVDQRIEGTGATVCLGIERGAGIVRVHDVKEIARMTKMMDAMLGKAGDNHG